MKVAAWNNNNVTITLRGSGPTPALLVTISNRQVKEMTVITNAHLLAAEIFTPQLRIC